MYPKAASGAPRLLSPLRATALFVAVSIAAPNAQVASTVARHSDEGGTTAAAARGAEADASEVLLLVGRSTVLSMVTPITRVSLTSPEVADAMVTAPTQLLIHGKQPGTISMFVWERTGAIRRYEVVVQRDLSQLTDQMRQLFPGEPIAVHSNGKDVVVSGTVSSKYVVDKAAEVAAGYVEKKDDVVNLLRQQEGIASNQVLLRVRFAEVSRSALTELGASWIANGVKKGQYYGRFSTQQFAAPDFDSDENGGLVFSDFLNLFLFDAKNQIGTVIKMLQNEGLFQSLAEPNLIAENGKPASFLAGGEYPYPVVQGQSGGTSVTIQFKEFGIKLDFTPTIVGQDLIKLKVRPEVSSLDFSNAVSINGFRVPALSTRRTETEVELQDGQTFAIAGLMNNTMTSQMSKIPGIGDIPILGLLFRSKAAQKNQTELVVMITPQILKRNSTGVSPRLPNIIEPYLGAPKKSLPSPQPWTPGEGPQAAAQPAPEPAQPQPAPRVSAPAVAAAPPPVEPTFAEPAPPRTVAPGFGQVEPAAPAPRAQAAPAPAPVKPTKAQLAAMEKAKRNEAERRKREAQAAEDARKRADRQAREDAKRAEADRKKAEKAAKEQAKLQAEVDRRAAEAAKRQAEVDARRSQQMAEAQARLDAARQAYESEVAKIKQDQKP